MLIYILTIATTITLSRLLVWNESREQAAIEKVSAYASAEYIHLRKRRLQHYKRVTLFGPLAIAFLVNVYLVRKYDPENVNFFLVMTVAAIASFHATVINWFGFCGANRCLRQNDEERKL